MDVNTTDGFELIEDFVIESAEALQAVPGLLQSHRRHPEDAESIHAAFRAIHSIKGCAACLGLEAYKGFAHSLEHTLADIRDGKQALGEDLQHALTEGFDCLDAMLNRALDREIVTELSPEQRKTLERVSDAAAESRDSAEPSGEDLLLEETRRLAEEISGCGLPRASDLTRRLKLLVDNCLMHGSDRQEEQPATPSGPSPADFRDVPCSCGEHDVTDRVALLLRPFLALREGECGDEVAKGFLAAATDFAAWAKENGHHDLSAAIERGAVDFRTLLESPMDIDEDLLSIVWDHLWPELEKLRVPVSGQMESSPEKAEQEEEPAAKPTGATAREGLKSRFVRIKEDRLDEFLEHVSRLFISGELLKDLQSRMAQTAQLDSLVEELRQIHRDMKTQFTTLQQGVMALRRVSISGVFSTFPRMARTLASQLGKRINVDVSGEDTEIDKLLAEDLDAPLTHLIRNVVDHGIETPDQRAARGLGESGNLRLKAEQTRNRVRITVEDDGRGIDPDRLRDKAVEKGICSRDQADALTEKEALNLIFHPGLSTAEKVSDVSGRGVGLDVVRTTLAKHDGEVTVESKLGVGTTFRLEIPIRQMVLVVEGLLARHAGQDFVVPFEHITEIIELQPGALKTAQGKRVATIRGDSYHAVSLSEILQLACGEAPEDESQAAVLIHSKHGSLCLLFDQVLGHRQVVLKNLDGILSGFHKISGVAQLGSGRMALVLNVPELVKSLKEQ